MAKCFSIDAVSVVLSAESVLLTTLLNLSPRHLTQIVALQLAQLSNFQISLRFNLKLLRSTSLILAHSADNSRQYAGESYDLDFKDLNPTTHPRLAAVLPTAIVPLLVPHLNEGVRLSEWILCTFCRREPFANRPDWVNYLANTIW